jgi:hypothetical protein
MKKLITTLVLVSIASGVFAQGQVSWANLAGLISTNTGGIAYPKFPGGSGPIGPAANGYYFTLLFDTATIPANNNPLTTGWTQMTIDGVPVIGTNSSTAGDMMGPKGNGTMLPDNWAAGQSGSFIIVGWSADLGTTWFTVADELVADWDGIAGDTGNNLYWFGVSTIGNGTPTASPSPGYNLWAGPGAPGFTLVLNEVGVFIPEPGTLALTALGGASLLLFRRKK